MLMIILLVCAVQAISAQCIGAGYGLAAPCGCETLAPIGVYESAWNVPCGAGFGPAALAASNGAGLVVTSASPIAPTGVSMTSENVYEGPLAVSGTIPFLGAVALDGALPTLGEAAVTYGCGNGNIAILSEDIAPVAPIDAFVGPYGYGAYGYDGLAGPYGLGPYGYDGLAGPYGFPGPYGYGYAGRGPYGFAGCGCA